MTALTPITGPDGRTLSRCDGHLVIDSTPLRGPAWWITDMTPAWRYGDKRGATTGMPRAPGGSANRRRRQFTTFTFQVGFGGLLTPAGAASALEPFRQMYENWASLRSAIVDDDGSVTKSSTFTSPDELDHTTPVQVLDLAPGAVNKQGWLMSSLIVHVPAGGWV